MAASTATPLTSTGDLKRHEKVVAAVDLPGVPAGTPGKVLMVNGFRWIRYRVRFDNGAELAPVERDQLVRRREWEAAQERTEEVPA